MVPIHPLAAPDVDINDKIAWVPLPPTAPADLQTLILQTRRTERVHLKDVY